MSARPFLKWLGGKTSSVPALLERIPGSYATYHEPFLGGGALFFALRPRRAVLSDSNERLIRTWRAVRDDVETLVTVLGWMQERFERDGEALYYKQRAREVDHLLDIDVAAWMIFLNKAGFNGLYRVNSKDRPNMPVGRTSSGKPPVICDEENLRACSAALQGVEIECRNFTATTVAANPGDIVYCDPPYVPVDDTSFTRYTASGFSPKDQEALAAMAVNLKARGVHVMLSNSSTSAVDRLYRDAGFHIEELRARRSINSDKSGRGPITEYLIRS